MIVAFLALSLVMAAQTVNYDILGGQQAGSEIVKLEQPLNLTVDYDAGIMVIEGETFTFVDAGTTEMHGEEVHFHVDAIDGSGALSFLCIAESEDDEFTYITIAYSYTNMYLLVCRVKKSKFI